MRILVTSKDDRLLERLKFFADESNKEYTKMRKSLKLRALGITRLIAVDMAMIAYEYPGGVVLDTPLTVPDMTVLREALKKHLHMELGESQWKTRLISNLNGFLTREGISFDKIEFIREKWEEPDYKGSGV